MGLVCCCQRGACSAPLPQKPPQEGCSQESVLGLGLKLAPLQGLLLSRRLSGVCALERAGKLRQGWDGTSPGGLLQQGVLTGS